MSPLGIRLPGPGPRIPGPGTRSAQRQGAAQLQAERQGVATALLIETGMPEVSLNTGHSLLVVSNREPYLHARGSDGAVTVQPTTGGVSVALDALMRARGGTWVAAGTGNADKDVVDDNDRIAVPVDMPAYSLRRIWLSEEEDRRYYNGFANEGLWPLAHTVHVRPRFRSEDWAAYQRVNARFAAAVADELTEPDESVFIQDYHLALVAGELRRLEPRVR